MRTGASGDSSPSRAFPRRGVRWLITFACISRAGASGDSSPSCAFPSRGIRWLLTFVRFSMQGHQVTPHLRVHFCAGGWGDSFAPRGAISPWMSERVESSTHGRRWCGAGIMWMWGYTLPTAASDVGLASCEWECPLHTADRCWGAGIVWVREQCLPDTVATDVGLVSCEWECPSTHGSHWCGAGIMWMKVSSTHGRLLLGGWYRVNKRAVSSRHGSHWWGAGIVWMSQVIGLCTWQNAALRRGAACLDSELFPCGICSDLSP